jgi:hypothetical protein
MTANSTEAETDKAIPLDKLSSRVGDQTGREGYVVFVLNIAQALNISHILSVSIEPVGAGLLANASARLISWLPDTPLSRASPLPHWICVEAKCIF